jgi:hypothetical protein
VFGNFAFVVRVHDALFTAAAGTFFIPYQSITAISAQLFTEICIFFAICRYAF